MGRRTVKLAFERDTMVLPLDSMLPLKELPESIRRSHRYRRMSSSIEEVGVIEPLAVFYRPDRQGKYLLLDGHKRRRILLDKGQAEARCILCRDDEAFTYNKRVSHMSSLQEHIMIVRAVERGVPEAKIAAALNVKVPYIRRRRLLLKGISTEAVDLLKDQQVNPVTFDALRNMKPRRQVEACKLMACAGNFTSAYAKALLAATEDADLSRPVLQRPANPVTRADLALLERELKRVEQDFEAVEVTYGQDVLSLVVATAYIAKLVANRRIERYLDDNHPELLEGFKRVVSATSLDDIEEKREPVTSDA